MREKISAGGGEGRYSLFAKLFVSISAKKKFRKRTLYETIKKDEK